MFFSSLVQADSQIATHVVPNLAISAEKANKSDANLANVAKCIGQVVQSDQGVAAGTIAVYSKYIKVSHRHSSLAHFSYRTASRNLQSQSPPLLLWC
jgi:cullin-associated NEDD8-dissociated protein 1